ncbi:MAG: UDP-N-acetylmuramoyl-L-alanyl-D-glutamate--2,6-diaminopimelate ligase [Wolbachia sp.]|nr:UDP-N-acetylmuramoyl-L-alanyl-D-glutamate--2,6-diaminopimelate ligase [Wolbachia sp.]MDD9336597.1 UDP-N-acetylmuramoyl-L-alanyl-D-glutamate--2,6-diaminopimelate ligase [Wolbachia sp.]
MRLKELLHNIVDIDFDTEIEGVTCNPRRIKEGYLFVCMSDHPSVSFQRFTLESRKPACIQILPNGFQYRNTGMTEASSLGVIQVADTGIYIFHQNPQEMYSEIVSRFYQFKQPEYVAAVTGTNGKTSVVEFCRQIWQNSGCNATSIGTLGTCINNDRKTHNRNITTPGAEDLYAILRDINIRNIKHLVLEASSHGIDQYRIHGLKLNAAAFTNFSQDHLDYHKNIDEYLGTKKKLFYEMLPEDGTAILNADIDEYRILLDIAEKRSNKIITYGKKDSNITLLKQISTAYGQHLTIKVYDRIYNTFFSVLGKFQAYNLLCAIGIIISSKLNYEEICVEKLVSPPGRIEKVNSLAFVDYAHTADALKQALLSLKWHFNKKIVLVFGCGGNRDQAKRSEMGKIAQMYADRIIITDDNSRDEDPAKIRHDILLHCPNALEIENRKKAIEKGVDIAHDEGMILLVAGRGHEKFQIVGDQVFEFSDVEVINYHHQI